MQVNSPLYVVLSFLVFFVVYVGFAALFNDSFGWAIVIQGALAGLGFSLAMFFYQRWRLQQSQK